MNKLCDLYGAKIVSYNHIYNTEIREVHTYKFVKGENNTVYSKKLRYGNITCLYNTFLHGETRFGH